MVLVKNPSPTRGLSPQREHGNNSRSRGRRGGGQGSRGNSPAERTGSRGSSPGKSDGFDTKGKGKNVLLYSRGNEAGSIERLIDGDKRIIATKHLLPENNINVVVRVRPLSNKEIKSGDEMAVQFPGDGQIYCDAVTSSGDKKPKVFSYNVVFEPNATQEDVLQYSGIKNLIEMAVEGFSCTVFCYGQTGSGKTHTLTGPPRLFDKMDPYSEDHGLVFRSFVYLFKVLQEHEKCNFVLKASFLEIYNEKVIDLLNPGTSRKTLAVRWSKKTRGFFVENLFTVECEELDDLLAVLEEGMRNRSIGTHNMNEYSSRSHSILTVNITSEQAMENGVFISKQGKINFVDLAGSEMTKKTQSEGKTLEEANNINKSLMVLGYCIASLSDGKRKSGHIPYRDSKLTKLLADSLAGNGVTLMFACVSPARSNANETLNTLRYAARAKKISTKPIIVMDPREALILSLKREVGALQTENDHLRMTLHLSNEAQNMHRSESKSERLIPVTPPPVDLEKLTEMESSELSQLIQAYITENEALRRENAELYATRDQVIRDQELVCRENERLLKKLEDVNLVCCRSPIIPARPSYSAELFLNENNEDVPGATNVWTNPNVAPSPVYSFSKHTLGSGLYISAGNMPEKVLKELDKRRIVGSYNNIAEAYKDKNSHRRHNSWDNSNRSMISPEQRISPIDINHQGQRTTLRRTSTVPEESKPPPSRSRSNELPAAHSITTTTTTSTAATTTNVATEIHAEQSNGSPDSILSGSLEEGGNSAPDSADSVAPTVPFPPISHSPSSFAMSESEPRNRSKSRASTGKDRRNAEGRIQDEHRAFGSPVPVDDDDRF
ncbi:Kinesin-like protein KIF12 [Trachymyrmex septentrionalis]|uniref:Kinesin-like protein n=1 Tax=Trachymyrmex septentrionalis TaxID=34720 RepID=A0A195FKY0_9HYME|nr:PREDICTED: kinesin-like protein KIF12 [Trachymyrmex septentrionalis]KYN41073.1 Kinesin-like protein KIF12 [Trachymyrmex septentrionalis]